MRLTPPKKLTFWIAVILGVLSIVAYFVTVLNPFALWIALAGLVLLVLGLLIKGF